MTDPLAQYADAMLSYELARDKARDLIKAINKIGSAMEYHLPAFLALNYQLSTPRAPRSGPMSREHQFKMDEWPDAETMRSTLTAWHSAFIRLNEAWGQIPQSRRSAMKRPPDTLSPK